MDGRDAAQKPTTTSITPVTPTAENRRCCCPRFRAATINVPTAAPAKANPSHGNPVKVVLSAAGRKYHCTQTGSAETNAACRTRGAIIAIAVATTLYAMTRRGADSKQRHRMRAGRQRERLQSKQEREDEDLEASLADDFGSRPPSPPAAESGRARKRNRESRQPEKQRSGEAGRHRGI